MTTYRVFMLSNDDHFVGVKLIDCATDGEAMRRAPGVAGDCKAVEIWEFTRRVERIDLRHPANVE
jgi:hypothetical protein